ncbi:hypothetical protein TWF788_001881 [Orbilia oligospora]|uniref:TauD/TfdA-like domain-containing protein n=1 Tax=Orbilia oligospora TaxID=2813651 RepID=A0A6G1MF50_ORBOL|nr:hypothetical protein TWF788_001881 [Orbilia oligospora]KAF3197722.1 hypothetical protein TWF679_002818 [Orbilia oligospora]KAF3256459.1 hypothetical protein TWF192_001884 [Orbilia oligospora]
MPHTSAANSYLQFIGPEDSLLALNLESPANNPNLNFDISFLNQSTSSKSTASRMAPAPYGQGAPVLGLKDFLKTQSEDSIGSISKINYVPCQESFEKREAYLKTILPNDQSLPNGFPSVVEGPLSWTASEVTEEDWLVSLNAEDVESVEAAMKSYLGKYDSVNHVSAETFPISDSLKAKMKQTVSNLYDRRGFAVVRGLDSSRYTPMERAIIFMGLSSYVGGKLGMQTLSRTGLAHLTNLRPLYAEGLIKSPGYTNVHMSFHNDTAHIIALFVAGVAGNGGGSMVASSAKVYNELAATKPHAIRTLSEDWKLNSFSSHDFDSEAYYRRPLLWYEDGRPILFVARRPFTGSNNGDTPSPLTLLQAEALDSVHFTAERHSIRIQLQKGDIQFMNNLAVVHSREEFRDASIGEGSDRRHLIRAFIKNEERAYRLPRHLDGAFNEIYPNDIASSDYNFRIDPFNFAALSQGPPATSPSGTNG